MLLQDRAHRDCVAVAISSYPNQFYNGEEPQCQERPNTSKMFLGQGIFIIFLLIELKVYV